MLTVLNLRDFPGDFSDDLNPPPLCPLHVITVCCQVWSLCLHITHTQSKGIGLSFVVYTNLLSEFPFALLHVIETVEQQPVQAID